MSNSGSLAAYYAVVGQKVNTAEDGDHVAIVFTDPPDTATDVEVKVVEIPEKGEAPGERVIIIYKGYITNKSFIVELCSFTDPTTKDPFRNPCIWIKAGSYATPVEIFLNIPDDREEGYRYDLRLDIKGKISGKTMTHKGMALLHVYYPVDVMIIPKTDGILDPGLQMIRKWAKQWKAHAPATRAIVEMALDRRSMSTPVRDDDFNDFLRSFAKAATMAHGGIIALTVGHSMGGEDGTPWTYLVPEDRDKFPPRLSINQNELIEGLETEPGGIARVPGDDQKVKLNALSKLGDILSNIKPQISELRIQSCMFGKSPFSMGMIADRVRVPVRGHTDFLDIHGTQTVYCHYPVSDDMLPSTETEENRREWLTAKLTVPVRPDLPPPNRRRPRRF